MPFRRERASKDAHAEFIENPEINSLVEQSKYLKEPSVASAQQLADGFSTAPENTSDLPNFLYASDGSFYEASLNERYPSTKVGYVKISSLVLDVNKYRELSNFTENSPRYIDPLKMNDLEKNVRALSMALPSANLRYKNSDSVRNGFRLRLYEELIHEKTLLPNAGNMLSTLFRLSASGGEHGVRLSNNRSVIFIYKCPVCEHAPENNGYGKKGYAITDSEESTTCEECFNTIYPSDNLRLHETITDHGGLSGGLSRIMNVSEYLLLAHTIIDCLRSDYISAISDLCFFVDGPLALFGQPAWLHRPIMELIYGTNQKLQSLGKPRLLMVGIQKQGLLAEHALLIAKYLPRNQFRFIDDEYRSKYISPVSPTGFGTETYFGQDLIYHTPKGNIFALAIPYPFINKNDNNFHDAKTDIANYPNIDRALHMVRIFEGDLYQGSLIPIVIAHRNASISRVPGGKVLDIASRVNFDRKIGSSE